MSSGNAKIGQPAPDFNATAVVKGQFENIKLGDYKGNCGGCFYIGFYEEVFETRYFALNFLLWLMPLLNISWEEGQCCDSCLFDVSTFSREVSGPLLLPPGLHVRVSHWDHCFQRQGGGIPQYWLRGYWLLHWLPIQSLGMVRKWRGYFWDVCDSSW